MIKNFDLVVIGGGPGGYVAAIRASQNGMKTAIVGKAALGGVCLNWGCIPTKDLLKSAEVFSLFGRAADCGIAAGQPRIDLKRIQAPKTKVVSQLVGGVTI